MMLTTILAIIVSEKPSMGPMPAIKRATITKAVTALASRIVGKESESLVNGFIEGTSLSKSFFYPLKTNDARIGATPIPSTKATTAESDNVA